MRHRKKSEKFSRSRAQRKALIKSLLRAIIINERITTTTRKAKALSSRTDKLISLAKTNSLSSRRLSYRLLESHKLVQRLFEVIGPRFKNINGGYTRVIKLKSRKGDGAPLSILELSKLEIIKKTKKKTKQEPETKTSSEKAKTHDLKKESKPKKGIIPNVRKIFKKQRDAV
jgi:large subunit ribosomal protein L17